MKLGCLIFCVTVFLASAISHASDLTGATVPPYPERWRSATEMCLPDPSDNSGRDCAYALEVQMTPQGLAVLFERNLAAESAPEGRWLVLDQINYPGRRADRDFVLASCERSGQLDPAIVALVKMEHVEWYRVLRAYRANFKTGKFDEIPLRGVRCFDLGWDA